MSRQSISGRSFRAVLAAAPVLFVLATRAPAQFSASGCVDHCDEEGSALDFDVRLGEGGVAADFVVQDLLEMQDARAREARELARRELALRVPLLALSDDPFFGTPHFLRSPVAFLTPPLEDGTWTAVGVVESFLREYGPLVEADASELERARVARDFVTRHNGVRHLTFQQTHEGLDLFGLELRANVSRSGELMNLSSSLLPRPAGGFETSSFFLGVPDALRFAASEAGVHLHDTPRRVGASTGIEERTEWASPALRSNAVSERVWFPLTRKEIRAAYRLRLPEADSPNTYEVVVDAVTGVTLWRWNAVLHAGGNEDITFRIYPEAPIPSSPGLSSPQNVQLPEVSRQLVTVTGASVAAASPDGWIDDGNNTTAGNNVVAQSDLISAAPGSAGSQRPDGSPFRVFDFPLDLTQEPNAYTDASVVQVFYISNLFHDRLHALGFDEASGNYQQNNFGNGGLGGDPMFVDAQDGSATNNARFFPNDDGTSSLVEMYRWTAPSPERDSGLESDILYHELAHGLSWRLVSSLNAAQSAGMGEGWSDFVGLSLNTEASDDPHDVYPMGGYITFLFNGLQANFFFGIRRFPYTTDMSLNSHTYHDIDPNQFSVPSGVVTSPIIGPPPPAGQGISVHAIGEVWCIALWECRANMIDSFGFAGNDDMLRLVVDGMKLAPANPDLLEARDAVLQAELAQFAGQRAPELWAGFAKRGMGISASGPGSNSLTGVNEAFDIPNLLNFTFPGGLPTQLQPGQITEFAVTIAGIGSASPLPGTEQLFFRTSAGGAFSAVPLTLNSPGNYTATIPGAECFDEVEFFLSVDTGVGTLTSPDQGAVAPYLASVFESATFAIADDFETNLGWTTSSAAADGDWQRGVPQDNGRGDPPSDFDGSGQCFLTDNDPSTINSDVDDGTVTLTSPPFDLSGGGQISYAYWLDDVPNGELAGGDSLDVQVATNGAGTNWITVRSYATASSAWRTDVLVAGVDFSTSSNTRVRFIASDIGDQNVVEAAIDAFTASTLECVGLGTSYCFGDGSGTPCPCGNNGFAGQGTGCLNSVGTGARLIADGEASVANDTLNFTLAFATPNTFGVLLSGDNQLGGGLGVQAFDGLRCMGGNLFRHGTRATNGFGNTTNGWGPPNNPTGGLLAQANFTAGQTRNFQVFYRDDDQLVCGGGQNTTNAFSVTFEP